MNDVYLSLGSNLGDRLINLRNAVNLICLETGTACQESEIYETQPWGNAEQGKYLNKVIKLRSVERPEILMDKLLAIEKKLGRTRNGKANSARLIDIDILFYDNLIISDDRITIPHPRLHLRNFVLYPLFEVAPDMSHPVFNKTIRELLFVCPDDLKVEILRPFINK